VAPPTRTPITRSDVDPQDTSTKKTNKPSVPSGWMTFGALSFIVLLILGIAALWRKHGPALPLGLPPEVIQVLGKRFVDQRQAIYLVRLGSKLLVLGSSPQGLQMLTEVTDPVEVDLLAGLCQRRDAEQGVVQTFSQLFSRGRPAVRQAAARAGNSYRPAAAADRFAMRGVGSSGLDLEEAHD
jgi:flagellar biogenesis protein FliO